MTNHELLKIAMRQSAYECNCKKEDCFETTNESEGTVLRV